MSNSGKDLVKLIHSLTKSEKRYFSLYASRHTLGKENNSLRMFKKLEALKAYNEKKFLEKHQSESFARHYRFNKHFLYRLILESLSAFHSGKTVESEIREHLNYHDVLAEKGLFKQALHELASAKTKAQKYQYYELLQELIRKELILYREQSLTEISEEVVENLFRQFYKTQGDITSVKEHESVAVRIGQRISKAGFIRNKGSIDAIKRLNVHSKIKKAPPQFAAALNFYTARVALAFITQDYLGALQETDSLLRVIEVHPHMVSETPRSYLGVLYNKIILLNNLSRFSEMKEVAEKIQAIPVRTQVLQNRKFYSSHNLILSMYPKTGEFDEGLELLQKMERELESGVVQFLSPIHRLTHNFSGANIHFGAGNFAACNKYLLKITETGEESPRSDIVAYAHIMRMIVQFEMKKQDLLEYTVRSVYRFLYRRKRIHKFEDLILRFIRKKAPLMNTPKETIAAFKELHAELLPLTKDPYEKNAFIYFDIISWLESKISDRTFAEVLKEKNKQITG